MMTKSILVTGAAGFIGFHACQALLERGDRLVALDNFNDYYEVGLKRKRTEQLAALGLSVVEGDIQDQALLERLLEEGQITHVLHLAAQAGVRYSLENPHAYIRSNVDGFTSVLEACRKRPGTKLVYASSSSVYGTNQKVPFSESDRTDNPASLYGATKKANEVMAQAYHHLYGLDLSGLRFFTVYGPWGRPDMAYYGFSEAILSGRAIQVFNHGKMQRDFTYIDDIVAGCVAALDRCEGCHVYNLGNHQPEPLLKLIRTLESLLGCEAKLEMREMQKGDVVATYADIEQSRRDLGFEPKTSLEDGLAVFVDWYRSYRSQPVA